MDVDFLMGKIKHLYYSTRVFPDFCRAVEEMLRPWFVWNLSWDDLEKRVKTFVQNTPLRATQWSGKDRLAALGLHWNATVTLPGNNPSKQGGEQPLSQGVILDTLVAKELKNYYGSGTAEENQAIAKYLKETYSFDVTHKPIQYEPAASTSQSSVDEMEQATMTNSGTAQEGAWLDQDIPAQSFHSQGRASLSRRADGSPKVRRIEADRSLKVTRGPKAGNRMKYGDDRKQSRDNQDAQGRWSTYSFIEGGNP
jgi:hypothetical protein